MKLLQIATHLDKLLKQDKFDDGCLNGVQVFGKPDVRKILTSVSVSMELISKAINENFDSIIVHHGLFWGERSYPLNHVNKQRLKLLLENNISLIAYHLPLDAHKTLGNNYPACREYASEFNGTKIKPFGSLGDSFIGASFELHKAIRVEDAKKKAELFYDHDVVHLNCSKKFIKKIAIVSGAGASFLEEAYKANIDLLITGEAEEWTMHEAIEFNVNVFACGHYATERIGIKMLSKYLNEKLNIESVFVDIPNPV
ncbi:Nif3-like dinuclear metal center hexameric protein [bacterium]|nr:Nif3-like dinuclear metal center hexameric protein [bacterium]|tara:strand:- start:409 stop:1176 length:768 start_codon:yes stop_codon:yes gene_type:complete